MQGLNSTCHNKVSLSRRLAFKNHGVSLERGGGEAGIRGATSHISCLSGSAEPLLEPLQPSTTDSTLETWRGSTPVGGPTTPAGCHGRPARQPEAEWEEQGWERPERQAEATTNDVVLTRGQVAIRAQQQAARFLHELRGQRGHGRSEATVRGHGDGRRTNHGRGPPTPGAQGKHRVRPAAVHSSITGPVRLGRPIRARAASHKAFLSSTGGV